MKNLSIVLAILLTLSVGGVFAETPKTSPDEAAVRKAVESYVAAYNRADVKAMASLWSRNGEYRGPSGKQRAQGPEKIRELLEAFFKESKGIRLKASVSEVTFPSADKAVTRGMVVYEIPGEPAEETRFIAEHVKEDGQWKIVSVEEDESEVSAEPPQGLKELGWLIGEWVDQDENATVDTVFGWAKNHSFISGSFRVAVKDRVDLEGAQVIGWDPVEKKIRSWVFDSKGSFGEGVWTREGDRWVVKLVSVLSNGEKASSVNIYTPVDANSFKWRSIGREVGGTPLPNVDEVTVVRKQAPEKAPKTKEGK